MSLEAATSHPTLYTPFDPHPTPYPLSPTPYTLHPTSCTLHPTPYTLRPPKSLVCPPCPRRMLPQDPCVCVCVCVCACVCMCLSLCWTGMRQKKLSCEQKERRCGAGVQAFKHSLELFQRNRPRVRQNRPGHPRETTTRAKRKRKRTHN